MKALSIRQPWAWMILHCGKDIENRIWTTPVRGRVLIHAAKGMTHGEWDEAWEFACEENNVMTPQRLGAQFDAIERGGIVGSVEIVDCVRQSGSDWFMGPVGFVLKNPMVLPFRPLKGALGFFDVPDADIPMTYAELKATLTPDEQVELEELAARWEYDGRMDREQAEAKAAEMWEREHDA